MAPQTKSFGIAQIIVLSIFLCGCTQTSSLTSSGRSRDSAQSQKLSGKPIDFGSSQSPEETQKKTQELFDKVDWSDDIASRISFRARDNESDEQKAARQKAKEIEKSLYELGPTAIPALLDHALSPDRQNRTIALNTIKRFGASAVTPMMAKLTDKNTNSRQRRTLIEMVASQGEEVYPSIEKLLKSTNQRDISIGADLAVKAANRNGSFRSQSEFQDCPFSEETRTAMLAAIRIHPDSATRANLAKAISLYGESNESIKPQLIECFKYEESTQAKEELLNTLTNLGATESAGKASEILKVLSTTLNDDKDPRVRAAAARSLLRFTLILDDNAINALKKATGDNIKSVQVAAFNTLIAAARQREDCKPVVLEALKSNDESISSSALNSLRYLNLDDKTLLPLVLEYANSHSARRADQAYRILAEMGPDASGQAVSALTNALKSNTNNKREAIRALERMGPAAKAAIPSLRAVSESNAIEDMMVRDDATRLLTKLQAM